MSGTKGSTRSSRQLSTVHPDAAGIDVGSTCHVAAVPGDRDAEPVRMFRTFSGDLYRLADWLTQVGITTIAMESTGVYWIPVFEILEARGFEVLLVNARDVKNVPGRKTDVNDAQWLQQLHQYGLRRGSFRPREGVVALRAYLRHRERLIDLRRVTHPADAEGADADGRPAPPRGHGHRRAHGDADHPRDCRRQPGARAARRISRPPVPRPGRDHPRGAHRQLPSRAHLRPALGAGAVRRPSGQDC